MVTGNFAEYPAGVQTANLFREDKTPVAAAAPFLKAARFQTICRQRLPSIFVTKSIRTILRVFSVEWKFSNFPITQQIHKEVIFEAVVFKSWCKNGRNIQGGIVKIKEI